MEQSLENNSVGSPHFDDERTVLAARPVVPLEIVKKRAWFRQKFILPAALVGALLLGAGTAVFVDHFRNRAGTVSENESQGDNSTAVRETNSEASDKASKAEASPATSTPPAETPKSSVADTAVSESHKEAKTKTHARGASSSASVLPARAERDASDSREPVMVDQWEERRMRRVQRRENRRASNQRGDLFRIREIFEGPRPE